MDQYHPGIIFEESILPDIKDLMIDAYMSGMDSLSMGNQPLAFEFLGFDFLIDEDFRVWLIEVNTNPYLGVPNDYIAGLLPQMVDDMIEITTDSHFPPNERLRTENDYELLFKKYGLNARREFKY